MQKPLPQPRLNGTVALEEALHRRRSVRQFTGNSLTDAEIGQLLWAAQGVVGHGGLRTAPSAGALYPLEIYVAIGSGLYHYQPAQHVLEQRDESDVRPALYQAALRQDPVIEAGAVFGITAVVARTAQKYGARAERYVDMESGHVAQNLTLQAVALNLGSVLIGAFEDGSVQKALRLPDTEVPLYLIPVGHPRT